MTAHLQGFEQILVFVDTDMANAQRFTRLHSDNVFWTPERGWLLWDGRRWQPDEQHRVMGLAKDTARKIFAELEHAQDKAQKELFAWARRSQSKDRLQAMIVLAQSEPNIPAHITEFDTDPLLLNCANGVVNLATGELMTHNPALMLSKITPIEYDAAASCPLWLGFLDRVMAGDDDMIEFLQRAMGYTTSSSRRSKKHSRISRAIWPSGRSTTRRKHGSKRTSSLPSWPTVYMSRSPSNCERTRPD